jgi:hypothetical protein
MLVRLIEFLRDRLVGPERHFAKVKFISYKYIGSNPIPSKKISIWLYDYAIVVLKRL